MFRAIKKELKIISLSTYYAIQREMLNKASFLSNVIFMILNNLSMIIQWIVLFNLKSNIAGFEFKDILLMWGMAASTYGFSHFLFEKAYSLSSLIVDGSLDNYLVQPKSVLLSAISSQIGVSALGDLIFGYIMLMLYGITLPNFLLFTLFTISGGIINLSVAIISGSFSFWFKNSDVIEETSSHLMVSFATYPGGIFKGIVKVLLYTFIPVGFVTFLPVELLINFDLKLMLIVFGVSLLFIALATFIFYRGLKRYSSSNLMIARI